MESGRGSSLHRVDSTPIALETDVEVTQVFVGFVAKEKLKVEQC